MQLTNLNAEDYGLKNKKMLHGVHGGCNSFQYLNHWFTTYPQIINGDSWQGAKKELETLPGGKWKQAAGDSVQGDSQYLSNS